jgi:hypothetical protein
MAIADVDAPQAGKCIQQFVALCVAQVGTVPGFENRDAPFIIFPDC